MSELLQFIIVAAFGALCFGGGYLTAFIVTRNKWRDEKIKRGVARYKAHRRMGMGRAAERIQILNTRPAASRRRGLGLFCRPRLRGRSRVLILAAFQAWEDLRPSFMFMPIE
jgi:hypothetical protein